MDDRNTRDSAFVEDDSSETAGEKNGECCWLAIFIFIPKLKQTPISRNYYKKDPTQTPTQNSKHKLTSSNYCLVNRKALPLALFHFGSPFPSKRLWFVQLWTLSCDFVPHTCLVTLSLTHVLWLCPSQLNWFLGSLQVLTSTYKLNLPCKAL